MDYYFVLFRCLTLGTLLAFVLLLSVRRYKRFLIVCYGREPLLSQSLKALLVRAPCKGFLEEDIERKGVEKSRLDKNA
jgi:hypothetical protein